ncbi:sensor histidine kinase [Kibdelosporangium philippinense]|uniref:histidine kinase n=1 Tax=Kibdelosporangium philippinense TaxID=211113 RepID=A0ABS8ZFL3_9PSEU|nr:sensor histidine kinase [Kibdelosporangium philippinense]MCE7006317.1 sensor histidine kinase [Kibdelosporangium philippinense]
MVTRPWIADTVWAVVLTVLSVAYALPNVTECLLALPLCASLAIRRTFPAAALAVATVAAAAQAWLLPQPSMSILAVPIMVYSLRRWSGRTLGLIGVGIAVVGALIAPVLWLPDHNAKDIAQTAGAYALFILAVYGVGLRVREREEAALAYARAQAAEERSEIAREVHDIVAHSLSLIAVQAEGGRSLVRRSPDRAPEILDVIADESRKALNEIREMVTLLRSGSLPTNQDGPAGIRELVGRVGDRAKLTVTGDINPALGFTMYRVVQEALTNFLRHAGPQATVDVRVAADTVNTEIVVRDNGSGTAATSDGKGHGLDTMRERVEAHGGSLTAGPLTDGGYEVHAVIPLGASREASSGSTVR